MLVQLDLHECKLRWCGTGNKWISCGKGHVLFGHTCVYVRAGKLSGGLKGHGKRFTCHGWEPCKLWQNCLLWPASSLPLPEQITSLAGEGEPVSPRVLHHVLSGLCSGAAGFPCQLSQLTPAGLWIGALKFLSKDLWSRTACLVPALPNCCRSSKATCLFHCSLA